VRQQSHHPSQLDLRTCRLVSKMSGLMKASVFQLTLCWVISLSFGEVTLRRLYGPGGNDSVTICPDDDYTLVFDCVVTRSTAFQWTLDEVVQPFLVTQLHQLGEYTEMFVTVVITEQDPVAQMFESRFEVPTRELNVFLEHRATPLEVVCKTLRTTKTISISGGLTNPPDVDTHVDYPMNEFTVMWSVVGIENIVNFVVFVENNQTGKFQTAIVGPAQTETPFFIEPDATMFNVTVVAYDTCQKSSSTTVSVIIQRDRIKSKTLTETSTSPLAPICTSSDVIRLSQSVVPPPRCVVVDNLENNQGCCIALGVITVLAFFALLITGIMIALCWKHTRTPNCVSPAQDTSLEMPEVEDDQKTVNQ
jgi:hypothetical protein